MSLLATLPQLPQSERAEVIERLLRSSSPGIRERAIRMGVAIMPDSRLIECLRDGSDAVLRNAALEILKTRGARSFSLAVDLLRDDEPDVALQGVLILDHIKDPRAVEYLRSTLLHADPNVAQAAIVAIGHLGAAQAIPDLLPFLESDTWLQVAAVQALGDLRSARAIERLQPLLQDILISPLAAEAIAQIGGPQAMARLAEHWLQCERELDPETSLGLLAHVLEGLERDPPPSEPLRSSLAQRLRDPFRKVRESAARCLLALGPGAEDAEALSLLAGISDDPEVLPSCLARRPDLVDTLLEKPGVFRSWGFLLSSRYPEAAEPGPLKRAMLASEEPSTLRPILDALSKLRGRALGRPLLDLYLGLPAEGRSELLPTLRLHRDSLEEALRQRADLDEVDRVILDAALGEPPETVARKIGALDVDPRLEAILQLNDQQALMRTLPWEAWLAEDPAIYVDAASQAAVASDLRELLPHLRSLASSSPSAELVRALGELADRDSVPAIIELLGSPDCRHLRPIGLEALGRIGGAQARAALRQVAAAEDDKEARLAYKALALCAVEDDVEFFRRAATHRDWLVRLAAVEVLTRFLEPENLAALSSLAADPVSIVAQRALTTLRDDTP